MSEIKQKRILKISLLSLAIIVGFLLLMWSVFQSRMVYSPSPSEMKLLAIQDSLARLDSIAYVSADTRLFMEAMSAQGIVSIDKDAEQKYLSSVRKIFQRKLDGSSGGQSGSFEYKKGKLHFAVSHTDCGYYDGVLLDFAIVSDRAQDWGKMKNRLEKITMTFKCEDQSRKYVVDIAALLQYQSNTISDFDFIDHIEAM